MPGDQEVPPELAPIPEYRSGPERDALHDDPATAGDEQAGGELTQDPASPAVVDGTGEPEPGVADESITVAPPAQAREPRMVADRPSVMIPARSHRSVIESFFVRLIATGGVVGVGVAVAAIMGSQHSHQWLIGLVVSIVSVVLAAILWSSQRL